MGTPLTGNTVASTYTGLLKTTDNTVLNSSLRTITDGNGNDSSLQISTAAVNSVGNFSVATNKFTVASASGNTQVAGTFGVTGATTLSSTLAVSSNISTSGGNLSVYGNIVQTNSGATNTIAGICTFNRYITFNDLTYFNGQATFNAGFYVPGAVSLANALSVTGLSTLSGGISTTSIVTSGAGGSISCSSNLTVVGNATVNGNAVFNGNTTIGNAAADSLTINAATATVPNIPAKAIPISADSILITDSADSSKLKLAPASAFLSQLFPQSNSTLLNTNTSITSSSTSFGTEIIGLRTSITPRSISSKVLVTIMINYGASSGVSKLASFRLTRNGTEIGQTASGSGSSLNGIAPCVFTDGGDQINNTFIQFWDSPASASSVEYRIYVYNQGATTATLYINYSYNDNVGGPAADRCRCSSNMVLQEYFA